MLHVIGEVFEGYFHFCAGNTDGLNHHAAHGCFHVTIDMFNTRSYAGFQAIGSFLYIRSAACFDRRAHARVRQDFFPLNIASNSTLRYAESAHTFLSSGSASADGFVRTSSNFGYHVRWQCWLLLCGSACMCGQYSCDFYSRDSGHPKSGIAINLPRLRCCERNCVTQLFLVFACRLMRRHKCRINNLSTLGCVTKAHQFVLKPRKNFFMQAAMHHTLAPQPNRLRIR